MTSKHFSEYRGWFPWTFCIFEAYILENVIFVILGHSDTISSIWNHRFLDISHIENGQKTVFALYKKHKNGFWRSVSWKWSEMPPCTFWVPIRQNRPKIGRENRFYDFSDFAFFAFLTSDFGGLLGVEISNRPNKVRLSKNCENLVFEITRFLGVRLA